MTTAVQHRRGTTAEHSTFTGLEGEVTIDTTKDTAVIHDGSLAGGYPLAKETLANVNPSTLSAITGAATASDDLFLMYDTSALAMKKISRAELNNAITIEALDNVDINGGTIDGTTIGGTTAAAGTFTTLTANTSLTAATADINGGTIDGSAIGGTTPAAGSFTTLAASGAVTLSGGTANGVAYLNGSKVLTSGSALTWNGSSFVVGDGSGAIAAYLNGSDAAGASIVGRRNSVNKWIVGDTINALGSGTGLINYVYGDNPTIWYNNGSEQMRLTSTGLGIGTSSPSEKLHVNSGAGNVPALFESTDALAVVQFKDNNSTLFNAVGVQTNALIFYSGDSVNMRLDSSGNLGLGVTPSASWSGQSAFQLGSVASVAGSSNYTAVATNAVATSSGWSANYLTNGPASLYAQRVSTGEHQWFTAPSGTAGNAISFSQAMTLDASGVLLVGKTSNAAYAAGGALFAVNGAADNGVSIAQSNATGPFITFFNSANSGFATISQPAAGTLSVRSSTALTFAVSGTESARIDSSGNLLVGTTSVYGAGYRMYLACASGSGGIAIKNSVSTGVPLEFLNSSGTEVGSVITTNTTTAYNTSSDYRLKEDWVAVADASTRVNALKPVNFAWKADGSRVDGFLAHELAEVVPEAVTGEKDAVDDEGNPVYQGIDQSKLVPLLTAALQEALAEIKSLKDRLDAANI